MPPNKPSLLAINQRSVSDWKGAKFELAVLFLLSPDNRISLVVTVFSLFFFNSIPPSLAGDGLCKKLNANYNKSVAAIVGWVVRMLGYEVQL